MSKDHDRPSRKVASFRCSCCDEMAKRGRYVPWDETGPEMVLVCKNCYDILDDFKASLLAKAIVIVRTANSKKARKK